MVCSDCVMFEETHKGHKILWVKEIFKKKLEEINKDFSALEESLKNTNNYLEKIETFQSILTTERDKRLK